MPRMRSWFGLVGVVLAACSGSSSGDGIVCGDGTHEVDGVCEPDLMCGPGTHAEGETCVPDGTSGGATFEIRLSTTQIGADGHSKVPVLVIGTNADGTPSTEQVVLATDRAGAGTFTMPALTLGAQGATTYFMPCNSTTPGCVGSAKLTLALASAPTVVVASADITLAEPDGVYTAAPCMTGGNVMFFDGNDYIYNGMLTVTQGTWSATTTPNHIAVHVTPSGQNQGLWWDFDFDSSQLGIPLDVGVYEGAERYPFESPDHPGIDVTGDGRGCNTQAGRFQVHEVTRDTSGLVSATVSFEQHCEGGAAVLNGCVHYER
jgi:hypothetical protein